MGASHRTLPQEEQVAVAAAFYPFGASQRMSGLFPATVFGKSISCLSICRLQELRQEQSHLLPKCSFLQPANLQCSLRELSGSNLIQQLQKVKDKHKRVPPTPPHISVRMSPGHLDGIPNFCRGGRSSELWPRPEFAFPQQEAPTCSASSCHLLSESSKPQQ